MPDKPSRREFVKTISIAGAAAVAGGVVGYAAGNGIPGSTPKALARIDKDGFLIIEDPELIVLVDSVYQNQLQAVADGRATEPGLRAKYIASGLPVNILCRPNCDPKVSPVIRPDSTGAPQ
jgi:hypothetical protein